MPEVESTLHAPHLENVKEVVWNQLSEQVKKEVKGPWENAKVEVVTLQTNSFKNAEKFMGKSLIRVSFESRYNPTLGPVTVFVDPQTQKIMGYGLRD